MGCEEIVPVLYTATRRPPLYIGIETKSSTKTPFKGVMVLLLICGIMLLPGA